MTTRERNTERAQASEAGLACAHCGLPVPSDLVAPDGEASFCCGGCRAVYGLIRGAGLDRFYELRAVDPDRIDVPANPKRASFDEFDDPTFASLHVRTEGSHRSIELYLEGVHCAACVWLVEKLPDLLEGVIAVRLDIGRGVARVVFDPEIVALSRIARKLDGFGYTPHPFRSSERRELARRQERKLLIRMGVAGAAAANVMLIAVAMYAGAGRDPTVAQFFRWASLLVTVPAILWAGQTFFSGALHGIRARTLHMDVPVSLALIVATAASVWHTVAGQGHVYFDSATLLMFLLLAARWAQVRALRAAGDASELLLSLAPRRARRVGMDDQIEEVAIESLVTGEMVEVLAGDSIPVDGVVVQGLSDVDNALLTGESKLVPVQPGDEVHAGAGNLSARLLVRTTAMGEHTRVGRLLAAVEEAQRRRAPIVVLADRLASYFVFAVLILASLSAVLWWNHGVHVVVERVVAMLVVTCPCALGLATPLALVHALGLAARSGIFIKGSDTIEALARVRTVLLDKTGTITHGTLALIEFHGSKELHSRLASLERESAHPVARAAIASVSLTGEPRVTDVEESAGGGIAGSVDGRRLVVGTAEFLRSKGCEVSTDWQARAECEARSGRSPVWVAQDGTVEGLAVFGDPIRPGSSEAVSGLKGLGLDLSILSGDHPRVVARVAAEIGLDSAQAEGGADPNEKLTRVERMMEQMGSEGGVAMVGDGANDAAALAAARVGIAVRGGAELSLATADVFLTRPGLEPVVDLFRGSRATLRVVTRNLGISLIYNVVGASLALAGFIDPLMAAILMPLSSLSVVLSSLLSRPFSQRRASFQAGTGEATALHPPTSAPETAAWR